jgi:hypothetical protein
VALVLFKQEASAQVAGKDLPFLSAYQEEIPYFQELICSEDIGKNKPDKDYHSDISDCSPLASAVQPAI